MCLKTNSNKSPRSQSDATNTLLNFTHQFHIVNPSVTVTGGERLDARVTDVVALRVCPHITRVWPVTPHGRLQQKHLMEYSSFAGGKI